VFTVTTAAWPDGDVIPAKYVFAGDKKSPAFDFKWVTGGAAATEAMPPATLQSYAIVFHDIENAPNAQTGEDTLHWMIWDIPGTAKGIPEALPAGDLPDGSKQAMGGIGRGSYFGPGAPAGPYHHYVFEFYALDIKLNLPGTTSRADAMKAMNGHVIGKAAYVGRYRNQ
jgi:Raf kinase inhibitor-like YbhB/YbcL family protein